VSRPLVSERVGGHFQKKAVSFDALYDEEAWLSRRLPRHSRGRPILAAALAIRCRPADGQAPTPASTCSCWPRRP